MMTTIIRWICVVLLWPLSANLAAAQAINVQCASEWTSAGETLHCPGGITIIAERGARYTLSDPHHDGRLGSVELTDKALLLEVPSTPTGRSFKVTTPQAIAAVRGTRWAVDAADDKTAVFVVSGRVAVGRASANDKGHVELGPGQGVDVTATGPLIVKRWAPARVAALMARLGPHANP